VQFLDKKEQLRGGKGTKTITSFGIGIGKRKPTEGSSPKKW